MSLRASPCCLLGGGGYCTCYCTCIGYCTIVLVIVLVNSGSGLKNRLPKSQGMGAASLLRFRPRNWCSVISATFYYSEWSQSTSSSKRGQRPHPSLRGTSKPSQPSFMCHSDLLCLSDASFGQKKVKRYEKKECKNPTRIVKERHMKKNYICIIFISCSFS